MHRFRWPFVLLSFCLLAGAARCWNLGSVFVAGRIYFVDADCYARMTRAARIVEGQGLVLRHHDFENFPAGTTPHTTAPLDWLIVAGKAVLDAGWRVADREGTSVLRGQTLDLAGALASPLLGVLTCAWLGWWARRPCGAHLPSACAWTVPLLFAISPVLVHGTVLGRPDHQSLVLLLLAVALGAEGRLLAAFQGAGASHLESPRLRGWSVVAGCTWALACWVSLYEPVILLALVFGLWGIGDRRRFTAPECRPGWIAFGAGLLGAGLIDGWRVAWPDAPTRALFAQWQTTIGELRHLDLRSATLLQWLGATAVLAPLSLGLAARGQKSALRHPAAAILTLLLVLLALTLWQVRWGYCLALVFAMSLPWQLAGLEELRGAWSRGEPGGTPPDPGRPVAWLGTTAFLLGLWPVARAWDATLYPDPLTEAARELHDTEGVQLRAVAERMRTGEKEAFLAPWWLSPALAYWSRQPGVAGSSHQALPGTLETARFFLAPTPAEAEAIGRRLGVRWIVTDGADEEGGSRLVKAYAPLLGGAVPETPWGVAMHERGRPREQVSADDLRAAPPALRAKLLALTEDAEVQELGSGAFQCVFRNQFFKLFRVKEPTAEKVP